MEPPIANYFREKTHWILFESKGKILGHSPGLAEFSEQPSEALFDAYPMMESILSTFDEIEKGREIVIPCVRTRLGQKEGWFDFVFIAIPNTPSPACCCWIMDLSEQYFRLFNMQQTMNQTAMELQLAQEEIKPATGGRQLSDDESAQPHLAGILDRIHAQNNVILDRLQVYLRRDHSPDSEPYA
ncbi:MAG TPA: hypothetical protein ENJ82_05935 [Bacteroidetes bacterium]|nr:hypothetical protein [Bacteroidota bacterium]